MRWRSPRLVAGIVGTVVPVASCLLGPLLLGEVPDGDVVRGRLLPPGTVVTAVVLHNGRVMVSPDAMVGEHTATLGQGRTAVTVDLEQAAHTTSYRMWLGSDRFGRDVLRQLLRGGRISIAVAALSGVLALLAGCSVGIVAATSGRLTDSLLMRMVDTLLAFPVLFLMILVSALARPSPLLLVVILGLTSWMSLARLVRGQMLSLRSRPFVLAARAAGSPWHRVWRLHFVPNLAGPVAQDTALRLGDLIIAEATLSFLGLGARSGGSTWGAMVAEGHTVLGDAWWLSVFPGVAIAWLVISLALIGDGMQQLWETG